MSGKGSYLKKIYFTLSFLEILNFLTFHQKLGFFGENIWSLWQKWFSDNSKGCEINFVMSTDTISDVSIKKKTNES